MDRFTSAKKPYEKLGIDVEEALEKLSGFPVSIHCWQGDDVTGFDQDGPLTGGIQTTGNYPGKARNPQELMADIDKVLTLVPGHFKLNLHASYAVFSDGEKADRDALRPEHFKVWVDYAKSRNIGLDFNPTCFSHDMVKDNMTLTHPDPQVRDFWVRHCQACIRISEYFYDELQIPVLMNIWIPDGYKDIPADRYGARARYKESLDRILDIGYDRNKVKVCVESKVFGIGMESYTAGSAEFTLNYAAYKKILPLMDNGHYHPTEMVSDKISSQLLFFPEIALHVTRPVRWDSDHVVLFDDETKEICKEIVRCDAMDRVYLATDFFDASINRIAAWTVGLRSVEKAMLYALLSPNGKLKNMQDGGDWTGVMALQEEMKTYPFGDIWEEYCRRAGKPVGMDWLEQVREYEQSVLSKRG